MLYRCCIIIPYSSNPPQDRQAKPESETMIRRAGLVYYLLSSTNKGCRMGVEWGKSSLFISQVLGKEHLWINGGFQSHGGTPWHHSSHGCLWGLGDFATPKPTLGSPQDWFQVSQRLTGIGFKRPTRRMCQPFLGDQLYCGWLRIPAPVDRW